jgi:hypothetical protein
MRKITTGFLAGVLISISFFSFSETMYAASRPDIYAESVLIFTNVERHKRGVPLLSSDNKLSEVALIKMRDMFSRQYFDHISPTGESVSDLAEDVGYEYIVVGENLAFGDFTSSKEVVEAWMDSKGHKENILADKYTEIGIAAGKSYFEGARAWIVVQAFGRPKSTCPAVDTELGEELERMQKRLEIYERVANIRKEKADSDEGTLSERKARVEAYNLVAKLYNNLVEKYRGIVEEYNETVGDYNNCLQDVIKDI